MVDAQPSPSTPRRRKPKREPVPQEGHDAALSRLLSRGAQALSDAELVAMLLGKEDSGLGRAQELIAACGGTSGLLNCNLDVTRAQALADHQAAALLAAVELGRRIAAPALGEKLEDVAIAARYLYLRHARTNQEIFGALFLDYHHRIQGEAVFFRGIHWQLRLDPQPILREAIRCNAQKVLIFHNHPTGDPTPSREDLGVTERMRIACELTGLELVDHLVLGGKLWISFRRLQRL